MIFNFTQLDFTNTDKLLKAKEDNILIAEFYNEYLTNYSTSVSKKDITNSLQNGIALKEAFFDHVFSNMQIDTNDKNIIRLIRESKINEIKLLNKSEYENNPYYQLIKNIEIVNDDWILNSQYYEAYEGFVYDEIILNQENYKEYTPLGCFNEKFYYPSIIQKDLIWMSIIPHEINTMNEPINNARGNVLVIGLGLGYFSYMVSNKKCVKSVTIVEKDEKVINIFNKYLLDKFENKKKIKIIHDDAFIYLKNCPHYDYVFIDIYHNVGDGFSLYLKLKKYEKLNYADKYDYWIETSLIAMLRRYVLTLYEEKTIYHYTENDYKSARNENDKIINALYFHLKDYQFNSYQEFHDFLSEENLKLLVRELNYE